MVKASKKSMELIHAWMQKNRKVVDPVHQIERYAWFRDNMNLDPNYPTLSIGCGESKVEEYIYATEDLSAPYDILPLCGLDINADFVESSSKRWPNGQFRVHDLMNDDFPVSDGIFEHVIAGDVIEHFPPFYLHHVLSESLRVLSPSGKLLITTPNGSCIDRGNTESVFSSDHCVIFTQEVLDNILNPCDESKQWWMTTGRACHGFNYSYNISVSESGRFFFIEVVHKEA